jgi:hypothetical protein
LVEKWALSFEFNVSPLKVPTHHSPGQATGFRLRIFDVIKVAIIQKITQPNLATFYK